MLSCVAQSSLGLLDKTVNHMLRSFRLKRNTKSSTTTGFSFELNILGTLADALTRYGDKNNVLSLLFPRTRFNAIHGVSNPSLVVCNLSILRSQVLPSHCI